MHQWAAKVIAVSGAISAETKAARSPPPSLTPQLNNSEEVEEEEEASGAKERRKVPHSLALGFMGLLPAVTLCSESTAP